MQDRIAIHNPVRDGVQTADFEAFAADTGEKGDGKGLYVAYSNLEHEAESAPYAFTTNENGQIVLTLTADDGVISWVNEDTPTGDKTQDDAA